MPQMYNTTRKQNIAEFSVYASDEMHSSNPYREDWRPDRNKISSRNWVERMRTQVPLRAGSGDKNHP